MSHAAVPCYPNHRQIEDGLWNDVRNRQEDWVTAPQGLRQLAHERLIAALLRLNGFVLQEKIPHELSATIPTHITPRELEVLERIAQGLTTKEIARDLEITFKTAATHRTHLLDKFDANNVALLVRRAIASRLIQP